MCVCCNKCMCISAIIDTDSPWSAHRACQGNMILVFIYWCSISSFCIYSFILHYFQHQRMKLIENAKIIHKFARAYTSQQFCNKINCTNGSTVNDRHIQSPSFFVFCLLQQFYYSELFSIFDLCATYFMAVRIFRSLDVCM